MEQCNCRIAIVNTVQDIGVERSHVCPSSVRQNSQITPTFIILAYPTRLYYVTPAEPADTSIPYRRTPFLVHTWHKGRKRWLVAVCEQTKPFGCVGVWPWDSCPFSNWVSSYLYVLRRACSLLQRENRMPWVDAFPVFKLHVGGEAFVLVCRGSERLIILLAPVTCLAFCRCQLPGHITATWGKCPVTEKPSFTANTVLGHLFYSVFLKTPSTVPRSFCT